MADVWLGRINRWIEKLYNVKGGPTVVDMSHTLQATISTQPGVEERYLQGWNRYGIASSITGGAGQNAGVELHNPLTSNVVAVVERIAVRINPATASLFIVSLTPGPATIADFATVQVPKIDGRQNLNSSLTYSTSTAAVGFTNQVMFASVNNGATVFLIQTVNQEIPLLPGSALIIVDNTVAEIASFELWWRERALETSEST